MTDTPNYYSLEKLLESGCQPFPDMTGEEFDALTQSIKTDGLHNPVSLTEDGTALWDGHQRCRALIALGRKRINADDVRCVTGITRENMWARSIAGNSVRRHLSSNDKAQAMHRSAARGWSQRKIARAFGMAQPSVSALMSKYPADADIGTSETTLGDDGKQYTRPKPKPPATEPAGAPRPPAPRPFEIDGKASLALRGARRALADNTPVNLTSWEVKTLRDLLRDLAKDCENFIDEYLPE